MSKYFKFWTSITDLADDFDVTYVTANSWVVRGEIPVKYDVKTVRLGGKRGYETSFEDLDAWHKAHRMRRKSLRQGGADLALPCAPFRRPESVENDAISDDEPCHVSAGGAR